MALLFPTLDAAIAKAEGYGKMGTIPTLANNPGDIQAGAWATAHGATSSVLAAGGQPIAVFPDFVTGQAAEDALIANNYAGGTVADLGRGWLGANATQSEVDSWITNLGLGVPSSTPVSKVEGPLSSYPHPPTGTGELSNLGKKILGLGQAVMGDPEAVTNLFGIPISRAAAFLLSLIVIAGALYLFKPVQNVVNTAVKTGAKVAVL